MKKIGTAFLSGAFDSRRWMRRALAAMVVIAVASGPSVTRSDTSVVCSPAYYVWSPATRATTTGLASAPAQDTSFNPHGHSNSYFSQGNRLFAVRNVAEPGCPTCTAGSIKWVLTLGATIQNFPSPVPLSSTPTTEDIFLTADNGLLYKIDAELGSTKAFVDTRRCTTASCILDPNGIVTNPVCATDQLMATPAVQLYNYANASFKSNADAAGHAGDDVVIVITRNQCGDTTHNRVVAYWASNLAVKWTFNPSTSNASPTPTPMDFGAEGCTIDYQTNTLYCGTNLPSGATGQNSLWAINSLTGTLIWSTNAGSLTNRPILANSGSGPRLYVAGFNGVIMVYDPAGDPLNAGRAKPLWSTFIQLPLPFARSPWAEFRDGPLQGTLLASDIGGNLHAIHDNGPDGTILWSAAASGTLSAGACPAGQLCFRGVPVVSPSSGNIYLGRNDGRLQQITATGTREGVIEVNPSGSNNVDVFDPSLDLEAGAADIDRLVVVAAGIAGANGKVTRVSVPICVNTPILTNVACGCGPAGVCGTGTSGDPFRCCNISEDTCATASGSNPCTPSRCSVEPDCCFDFNCADPTVLSNCGAASFTCVRDGGSLFKVPDGTACDDLQPCTSAFPAPVPLSCVGTDGSPSGGNCTRDSDCPAVASSCSGTGTATPGQGGGVVGGKCCPVGTACDFATNQCLGNNGTGATSSDVCRDGFCSSDNYASCSCENAGDRACPPGLTCCGASNGGCVNLLTDPLHCGSCTTVCSPGAPCQQGICHFP